METTPQQRDNRTNTLSEEHVHTAIEAVLANRVQSYDEFMSAFTVLTPDDVDQFSARRSSERIEGQIMTSEGTEQTPQLFQMSSTSPRASDEQIREIKQVEEIEIEELGEDFTDARESLGSDGKKNSSKYLQVDNYLDEPDSESELLSDDEDINFDDSSSKYVASFDTETETKMEAANSRVSPLVTPEMLERVNEIEENIETGIEDSLGAEEYVPENYPGEVEDDEVSSSLGRTVHITQLPNATGTHIHLGTDKMAEDSNEVTDSDVQPFSIDPDFDYDNVILTPKWEPGLGPPSGT